MFPYSKARMRILSVSEDQTSGIFLEKFWAFKSEYSADMLKLVSGERTCEEKEMAETESTNLRANEQEKLYSVGDLCRLTKTTRKTLFYYDRIGLLKPTRREGAQNFKEYDSAKLLRLKKILLYREAGLRISEIREMLDDQDADRLQILHTALQRMRSEKTDAEEKIQKLQALIREEYESEGV